MERAGRCGTRIISLSDDVIAWRHRQLIGAGFSDASAARMAAMSGLDLHDLLSLVDRGCPPDLAARIIEPLAEAEISR